MPKRNLCYLRRQFRRAQGDLPEQRAVYVHRQKLDRRLDKSQVYPHFEDPANYKLIPIDLPPSPPRRQRAVEQKKLDEETPKDAAPARTPIPWSELPVDEEFEALYAETALLIEKSPFESPYVPTNIVLDKNNK